MIMLCAAFEMRLKVRRRATPEQAGRRRAYAKINEFDK